MGDLTEDNIRQVSDLSDDDLARVVGGDDTGYEYVTPAGVGVASSGMGVEEMRLSVQNRWGNLTLRLSFGGEACNPLTDDAACDEDGMVSRTVTSRT